MPPVLNAAVYTANTDRFEADLGKLRDRTAALKARHTGDGVAITEPAPLPVSGGRPGQQNPEEFSHAIEAGHGFPVAVMKDTLDLTSARSVKFLAYNNQSGGPQTIALKGAATKAEVPVIDFAETLPEGQTYLQWISTNFDHIDKTLQG